MTIVAGLDLSLTSTGVAFVDQDGVRTFQVKTKGRKGATASDTAKRLDHIIDEVLLTLGGQISLAVIEAPSYGSNTGSQHERGGLWWGVARALDQRHVPIATVSPQGRAKYATGKGNAGKDEVLAAVIKRYADIEIKGNDVADAVVLLAMGLRHLGTPIDDPLPQLNLAAMAGASWPE